MFTVQRMNSLEDKLEIVASSLTKKNATAIMLAEFSEMVKQIKDDTGCKPKLISTSKLGARTAVYADRSITMRITGF